MTKIQIYDPALCCSTGICGVDVDQEKVTFAANVDWLKSQGGRLNVLILHSNRWLLPKILS